MNLYPEQQVVPPFPEVLVFPKITSDNADWLDRLFEKAEIFYVNRILMGINRLDRMGFQWLSSKHVGVFSKLILWLYFIIFFC